MSLEEKIMEDLKVAMKAQDKASMRGLRAVKSICRYGAKKRKPIVQAEIVRVTFLPVKRLWRLGTTRVLINPAPDSLMP